ncbi:recombinase family protein [Acetobacter sp.]|jgi:putative DNA-invertase from lambdoid prophage Rac|uniref:recombinase family protein n=1 Tax=Acetobacter sp. TaxID=440 RepID=UPI0025C1CDD5|nr:recombinase family protein [Acetobacter sp.]MCH4092150.1 recombinase family protein [Acetobacter sp.]MCI1299933.1 recombinase family protein [Acetobacter sp.]MCI1315951.1 recombinase family protein [Acetobacter sp.]
MERYGYMRVSTSKQTTDSQFTDLTKDGVVPDHIVAETLSGSLPWRSRPRLRKLIRRLKPGDSLTVAKIDRLGRNAIDVLTLVETLKKRDISVRILNLGIDTSGAGGKLFLLLLAGFSEFERNIIHERIMSGLETGRAKGKRLGRKPILSPEEVSHIHRLRDQGLSIRAISDTVQVSKMTVWRALRTPTAV